jgi:hypothetical protein
MRYFPHATNGKGKLEKLNTRMHGLQFSIRSRLGEERRNKELSESDVSSTKKRIDNTNERYIS